jgi:hypothetical protein
MKNDVDALCSPSTGAQSAQNPAERQVFFGDNQVTEI